jgi:hypothetical protein
MKTPKHKSNKNMQNLKSIEKPPNTGNRIKEDLNKWRGLPSSFDIVKIAI